MSRNSRNKVVRRGGAKPRARRGSARLGLAALAFSIPALGVQAARADYTLKTLATFNNNIGTFPYGSLIADSGGNLYGTTSAGGANNDGTVFKLTPSGTLTTLASFNGDNGAIPYGSLIADSSGNFYGTTSIGGANNDGAVFKLTPTGTLTALASFNGDNGANPHGSLIADNSGNFYGTTSGGGAGQDGTVFRVTPTGTLTAVSFDGANGAGPLGNLIADSSGNFYGTANGGGAGVGTVFKLTPGSSALTALVSFSGGPNGAGPHGSLIADSSGNFYGTTSIGGANNDGTVFKLTPSGTLTTLASFSGANGAGPQGSLIAYGGNFYGTTGGGGANSAGTVFELTPGGTLTTLASFNVSNGSDPLGSLIADSSGNLYGTTSAVSAGGTDGYGTVFELVNNAVPEPSTLAIGLLGLGGLALRRKRRVA